MKWGQKAFTLSKIAVFPSQISDNFRLFACTELEFGWPWAIFETDMMAPVLADFLFMTFSMEECLQRTKFMTEQQHAGQALRNQCREGIHL